MRYRWVYFLLSAIVLVPGMFMLLRYGLRPGIDFTGGTLLEYGVNTPDKLSIEKIRQIFAAEKIDVGSVQFTSQKTYIIRSKTISKDQHQRLTEQLDKVAGKVTEVRFETVGPTLGKELLQKTFVAVIIAITAILLYVAWAFKNIRFGVSAVLALLHDVLVVVGVFAILGKVKGIEVDSLFVTAVLTTMSFSVHDTIVVFDRIRESQKKISNVPYTQLINQALSETMSRSLNNSLTIVFMLLALFLLGGDTIRWFVCALLVGTISGAYSSPFVATPILYTWHQWRDKER